MTIPKQLGMLYLANDILQNSRKKGPEFVHEFYRILPRAVKHLLKHGDEKAKRAASRLVEIWEDRKVGPAALPLSTLRQYSSARTLTTAGVWEQRHAALSGSGS